jgi:hypothetical protein
LAAGLAVAALDATGGYAAAAANCTYEQKQARTQALTRFRSGMAKAKAAYYRKVKNRRKRAAFVAAQQRKLRTLKSAAACTVPPLPPSSAAGCSPSLTPHPSGFSLSEGPIDKARRQASTGRIDSIALFFDYSDAPGEPGVPPALASTLTPEPAWFQEVSHGRLAVALTPVARWIRMPSPMSSYQPLNTGDALYRYARDAISAADPSVDFAAYNHVTLLNPPTWPTFGAIMLTDLHGYPPITADGVAIRFGVNLPTDARSIASFRSFWVHEQLHVLGLPDLGGRAVGWDTTSYGLETPALTHLLGWHKWLLGWLDPAQLTCVSAPGTIEETLTPIAATGGKKLVFVHVAPSFAYAVEVRRPIGYDRNACDEGVVVYSIDSQRTGYEDPVVLRGPRRCGTITPGAFKTGAQHQDEHVKIEVLATNGRDYRVRVTKK